MDAPQDSSEIRSALKAACDSQSRCVLVSLETASTYRGHLQRVEGPRLRLDLRIAAPIDPPKVDALVSVSFRSPRGGHAFVTTVLARGNARPAAVPLVLRLPTQISWAAGRTSDRIDVRQERAFVFELVTVDGRLLQTKPVDISLGGAQVLLPKRPEDAVCVHDRVTLRLRHQGRRLSLNAQVRYRINRHCGLSFTDCYSEGRLTPHPTLQEIIGAFMTSNLAAKRPDPTWDSSSLLYYDPSH